MPEIFIPFGAFAPEGGDVGEGLVRADNAIPIHRGHRPLRQRADVATLAADGPVTGAFVHIFQAEITEQHALPIADEEVHIASVGSDGRTEDLWELIDKTEPDDESFIVFGGGEQVEYQATLEPLADPTVDTGHIVRFRYRLVGIENDWVISVNIVDAGAATVASIDNVTGTDETDGWVEHVATLDTVEADNLVNYGALAVVFTFTLNDGGPNPSQFGRPVQDLALNGWTKQDGSASSVFQAIDETVASDTDYAQSPPLQLAGARKKYRVALTDLVDPFVKNPDAGTYTLRYRYLVTNAGVNVKVTLGHGGTGTGGTAIVTQEHTGITPGSFIAGSLEIEDEIWAIASSAYESLWLEFEGHWPAEGSSVADQTVVATDDVGGSGFTPSGEATIWEAVAVDDADNAQSNGIFGSTFTVAAPAVDPGLDTAHIVRLKGFSSTAPTQARGEVQLYEGTVQRWSSGDFTVTGVGTEKTFTLHPSFVASIGDYANLRFRVIDKHQSGDGALRVSYVELETPAPRRAQISWAELETPSTAQGRVSLVNLSVPAVATEYQGDKPTLYAGTPNDLYEVDSAGFTEISKVAGAYTSGAAWRFAQIGNHVIATNAVDPVQWREDSTGDFDDLITAPSPAPAARFLAPWRERLLLGSIALTGHAVDEIWISAPDDIQDFEPDETTRAGFEPIRSKRGQLTGLVGGQEGVIFKRNSIFQMLYTGGTTLFRIEEIPDNFVGGLAYPGSLVEFGQYFYGHSGECFFRGSFEGVERIGDGAVTQLLTDSENLDESIADLNPGSIAIEDQMMVGAVDPKSGLILWTYQAKDDAPWQHSRGVLYNPLEDRWTPISGPFDISAVCSLPNSINTDSHLLKGVYAFSWDGTDATWFKFSGDTMEVVFDTKLRRLPASTDAVRDPTTGRFAEPAIEPMLTVRAVRPVFSFPRSSGAVPLPEISSITATGWRDADRTSTNAIEQDATPANRNDRGIWNFGRGVQGFYHSFAVTLAPSMVNAVYNLVGLWVDYQVGGAR